LCPGQVSGCRLSATPPALLCPAGSIQCEKATSGRALAHLYAGL